MIVFKLLLQIKCIPLGANKIQVSTRDVGTMTDQTGIENQPPEQPDANILDNTPVANNAEVYMGLEKELFTLIEEFQ